jgi:homoserine O-acetyltransferase
MSATRSVTLEGRFRMKEGVLATPTFAYETWGELDGHGANAVLVFTGLSPSAHAASSPYDRRTGWWEDMIGPDKPIDTSRFFVICVNSLGRCFGRTGPASVDPATGEPDRLSFPVLHVEDIANGGAAVLDHHGIERLHTVLGSSMGGMTAQDYALLHPQRARGLVTISSAARSQPFSIAVRSLQREIIRRDPAWNGGNYHDPQGPAIGMRLARKLGMISYRSADEWAERFGRERSTDKGDNGDAFSVDFEVEAYLEAHARKFVGAFDANCYLYLSRAMDLFDVADHGGCLEEGFSRARLERAMVIGVESDILFPVEQQQELAECLEGQVGDVVFHRLASIQGHDSFLVDMDRFRPVIARYFKD